MRPARMIVESFEFCLSMGGASLQTRDGGGDKDVRKNCAQRCE